MDSITVYTVHISVRDCTPELAQVLVQGLANAIDDTIVIEAIAKTDHRGATVGFILGIKQPPVEFATSFGREATKSFKFNNIFGHGDLLHGKEVTKPTGSTS